MSSLGRSYVTLEVARCPVCGQDHDTGALLLDRRLRPRFESKTVTGWQMCDEHQKLKDDGYIALVEVDPKKSSGQGLDEVWRTGRLTHLRSRVWSNVFDTPVPSKGLCFVEIGVIDKLERKAG